MPVGAVTVIDPFVFGQEACTTAKTGLLGFALTVTVVEVLGPLHPLSSHRTKYFVVVAGATFVLTPNNV